MLSPIFWLLHTIIDIATFVIIAQAVMSWLLAFGVINLGNNVIRSIWETLHRLTEPVYSKIRGFIPNLNGIDLSPIVALIGLYFISLFIPRGGPAF